VKHLEEQMAIELARWDPTLKIIALRLSNVMDPSDYAQFPAFDTDAALRKWNLWGYIDGRDGAQAVLKALELRSRRRDACWVTTRSTPGDDPRSPA
jgi:nucleoside-diphosphate-sugar epimerase